jgi:CBS domain containing-hemolysin-like protein
VIIFFTILGLLLLIGFGGLMAASEAAMGVLSSDDIREQAQSRRAKKSLISMSEDMGAYRTVTTFVRILVETSAAVIVTVQLIATGLPSWAALLLAILIMSVASFVLAGSSPRSVGRANPMAILAVSAPIIHLFRVILGPLANSLVAMGNKVTPGRSANTSFSSEEQLLSMVDEAVKNDVLESDERELIHSIFEWGETVAREVMVPRTDMVTVNAETTLSDALKIFHDSGFSRLPVVGDDVDAVLGVLNLRDLSKAGLDDYASLSTVTAAEIVRPAVFIPESKKADETLKQLQSQSTHMAFVVDEYGGIAGLLTLEDLIEELVGEISDEYDRGAPDVQKLDDSTYLVATRLPVDELGELFGLELEDEDVDSVGGLLTKELGRLPIVGDSVSISGLILTADKSGSHRKRVTRVVVTADQALVDVTEAFSDEDFK